VIHAVVFIVTRHVGVLIGVRQEGLRHVGQPGVSRGSDRLAGWLERQNLGGGWRADILDDKSSLISLRAGVVGGWRVV
jgi:hypothetical protein